MSATQQVGGKYDMNAIYQGWLDTGLTHIKQWLTLCLNSPIYYVNIQLQLDITTEKYPAPTRQHDNGYPAPTE
jgi:hypothetical protein